MVPPRLRRLLRKEVCEIGWQDVVLGPDGRWSVNEERGAKFVNPGRPISTATMAVHHIMDGDVAYVMEGDQTELNDFMGQCIQDAYKQTCLPDPQTARDSGSARTWLFEDEMPWTVESGSTGSAKE